MTTYEVGQRWEMPAIITYLLVFIPAWFAGGRLLGWWVYRKDAK